MNKKEKNPIFIIDKEGKQRKLYMNAEELIEALEKGFVEVEDEGKKIENFEKVDDINYFLYCDGKEAKVCSRNEMRRMGQLLRCRACNNEVSIDYYKQGKICPHCGRKVFAKDVKDVYVSLGTDNFYLHGLEKHNEYERSKDYELYTFCFALDSGDISNYVQEDIHKALNGNQEAYSALYFETDEIFNFALDFFRDLDSYGKDVNIYLCRKKNDSNGILNMYYLASKLKKFNNVYEVEVLGDLYLDDSLKNKKLLSNDVLLEHHNRFVDLASRGEYYRVLQNGKIKSFSRDYFESDALGMFTVEYSNRIFNVPLKLCGIINAKNKDMYFSYRQALLVMRDLLNAEKIETDSPIGYGVGGCDYRGEFDNGVQIRLKQFKEDSYSLKEIQNKMLKTLFLGSAHYVYNILDDNVVYYSDANKNIVGKDVVSNYIESIAVKMGNSEQFRRYRVNLQDINGESVLYISYPWGETDKVELEIKDNKIISIKMVEIDDPRLR